MATFHVSGHGMSRHAKTHWDELRLLEEQGKEGS